MRWLEYRRDRIDDLWLDRADIARRMEQPHVKRLAESFDATGGEPGNAPWVTDDGALVAGRDRIAAAMLRGAEEITVRVGEFTPYELRRATLIEQLRRPANQDALVAELVALKEQEFREGETTHDPGTPGHPACPPSRELPNNMFTNSPGRPTTPRGAARAAVAVDTGKTVDAVRAAERRAEQKAAPSVPPNPPTAPPIRKVCPMCNGRRWIIEDEITTAGAGTGEPGGALKPRADGPPVNGDTRSLAGSNPARPTKQIRVVDEAGAAVEAAPDDEGVPF